MLMMCGWNFHAYVIALLFLCLISRLKMPSPSLRMRRAMMNAAKADAIRVFSIVMPRRWPDIASNCANGKKGKIPGRGRPERFAGMLAGLHFI